MGVMDARNMYSNLAVNKCLHTAASRWSSSTHNYDARNHEYKNLFAVFSITFGHTVLTALVTALEEPFGTVSVNAHTVTLKSPRNTFNWIEQECLLKELHCLEERCEKFPASLGTKYQFDTHTLFNICCFTLLWWRNKVPVPVPVAARSEVWVCGRSPAEIAGSNPTGVMDVCLLWVLCVLLGRGLCDELITHPEESYRLWSVVECDLETSIMRRPWPTRGLWHQKQTKNKVGGYGLD